jgi:Family of unknown function (DUF5996)/Aldo/keto reductase family
MHWPAADGTPVEEYWQVFLASALRPIAERHGVTPAAIAVAWTLSFPGVTGAIAGAGSPRQIEGWLPAAHLELREDDLAKDYDHARYDPGQVRDYFAAATQAALALAAFHAPYRGRSTPVNAWWGTFDLAVTMFSARPANPRSDDFITRNSGEPEMVTVGWWAGMPGTRRQRSTPSAPRPRPASLKVPSPPPRPIGTSDRAITSWTGTTSAPRPTRAPQRSSPPAPPSTTPAR